MQKHTNLIIDARLGWYVVPDSFKVYLRVDLKEAARRAYNDENRKDTEEFDSLEKHMDDLKKRYELENERYFNLYGIRKDDMSNYDYVLDTTNLSKDEVCEKILENYLNWKAK